MNNFEPLKIYEIEITIVWHDDEKTKSMWGHTWTNGQTIVMPFVREPYAKPKNQPLSTEQPRLRRFIEYGGEGDQMGLSPYVAHLYVEPECIMYAPWSPFIDEFDKDEWIGSDTASDKFDYRCGHFKTKDEMEIFWRCGREESRPFNGDVINYKKWEGADPETLNKLGYYW